ncbi:alanine/glycine:cation symporter family protein [Corynebacterium freiburgense]|uniref:alanine/glycine:cation symporter family protein n=1 Tax=Corynebacterium freiburgense TaxID=556548 RepID=UPI000683FFEF|nr:alanine/glycine:cation symporter family protein [Corynebacterium freiburgense]WJZ02623.1 Amino-acid carrier protein AlsT [Corynebacterium freiburgense]
MDTLVLISDGLWNPMAYFALGVGLVLTIVIGGAQFGLLPHTIKLIFQPKTDTSGISSVQALLLTIASRVGVGNIAGVATAIAAGGPGALFWMVMCALLGSAASFAESSLAQVYKRKINGELRGGMPFYVEYGLKLKWLAAILAIMTALGYGVLFPGVQSNNIANAMENAFAVPNWVSGVGVVAVLALVIFGGTKRIVRAVDLMVPVMAIGYIFVALAIVILNYDLIIPSLQLIFESAFGTHELFGGIAGAAMAWGVRRAVFSNVAGVGEGTYGAAAAAVNHPAQQGLVQSFSIFVDTCIVCFATGTMIVITGSYNVYASDKTPIVENLPGVEAGAAYTQNAVDTLIPGFGSGFVAIALLLFAFTTLVAFYYIAHTNLVYLFGHEPNFTISFGLKFALLGMVMYGAIESAETIWTIGDIGYASLGWINMFCILMLIPVVRKVIVDYRRQLKANIEPAFEPGALGIEGADFWEGKEETIPNYPHTGGPIPLEKD